MNINFENMLRLAHADRPLEKASPPGVTARSVANPATHVPITIQSCSDHQNHAAVYGLAHGRLTG